MKVLLSEQGYVVSYALEGDLLDTIGSYAPDLVLTLYTASTTGLENMFQFDKTEG